MSSPPTSPPKIRDAVRTKAAILAAAQAVFSERGYTQVGVREIAARAGINAALVLRYFGAKERLFEAALAESLNLRAVIAGNRQHFGLDMVRLLTSVAPHRPNPVSMLVMATADPVASQIAQRLLNTKVINPLAEWLGGPDASARAAMITALCSGFLTYHTLLPVSALNGPDGTPANVWLATSLQNLADGFQPIPRDSPLSGNGIKCQD